MPSPAVLVFRCGRAASALAGSRFVRFLRNMGIVAAAVTLSVAAQAQASVEKTDRAAPAAKPALTVQVTTPRRQELPVRVAAHGSIAAWQEASVGAEGGPWRLAEVRVQVGDRVRRGQVLAVFDADLVQADLALARAGLAEAEAVLAEMTAKAHRARELQPTGVLSTEQVQQALTAERTAQARLQAQQAALRLQELRGRQTQVTAPDEGVISARSATVGAVVPPGQELFRLIRQGRLEWRAEVASADLARIRPGQMVQVSPPGAATLSGRVRTIGPTVDTTTRNGLVYVDLPPGAEARAGMFARGEFVLAQTPALTVPASAVLLREGLSFVFAVDAQSRARETKVGTGRRVGDQVEIISGLADGARVVVSGGGFLADGDAVRVVETPPAARPTTAVGASVPSSPSGRAGTPAP